MSDVKVLDGMRVASNVGGRTNDFGFVFLSVAYRNGWEVQQVLDRGQLVIRGCKILIT